MSEQCPFCWSKNINRVAVLSGNGTAAATRRLMECGECEKWFWAGSGQEVPKLFEICVTSLLNPGHCDREIREILASGGNGFPRRRVAEFNRLCSDCPNSRFIAGNIAAHA